MGVDEGSAEKVIAPAPRLLKYMHRARMHCTRSSLVKEDPEGSVLYEEEGEEGEEVERGSKGGGLMVPAVVAKLEMRRSWGEEVEEGLRAALPVAKRSARRFPGGN